MGLGLCTPVGCKPWVEQHKLDLLNEVELVHHILLNVLHQQHAHLEVLRLVLQRNHDCGPGVGIVQP